MNVQELRSLFPALSATVHGKPLVYFDNAATSQRPQSVLRCWEELSGRTNANIHRAVHALAGAATERFEQTRERVRAWLNAASTREIIFTSGATHALNLLAFSFGEAFVREGDEILVGEAEHHSDIVPWQMMCARKGASLKVWPVDDDGMLRMDLLPSLLTERVRLVAVAHISNVLGLVNPIREIAARCHAAGAVLAVDGAQGIVHELVDVQQLDCDFYAFSGHKMYAATGTGVLYGREELLKQMPPYMGGGEMIETVKFTGTIYAPLPGKFEAGTQNFNAIPTLVPAIELMEQMQDEELLCASRAAAEYLTEALTDDARIRLFGVPRGTIRKAPVFSFVVEGAHHEDIALILDKMGIAVRSGQMCAEPLMDRFGVTGMVRVSLAPYNTLEEAEYFVQALQKALDMLI